MLSDADKARDEQSREVRRRAGVLARRLVRTLKGPLIGQRVSCTICDASIYFNAIEKHYEKKHADALLAMAAEAFTA